MKRLLSLCIAMGAFALSAPASASIFYHGSVRGDFTADFYFVDDLISADSDQGAAYVSLPSFYADPIWTLHDTQLAFYDTADLGGLAIYDWTRQKYVLNTVGEQIFSGTIYNPVFHVGRWDLVDIDDAAKHFTLTFTLAPWQRPPFPQPAVPEPASWAMMVCGFGLAGAALRNRHKTAVSFA